MNLTLPLNQMTMADKLRTMESLWIDLCEKNDELDSPSWHNNVLIERENNLVQGKERIHDWTTAKKRIRKSI